MLQLIEQYFHQNCTLQEILDLLRKQHGISISRSTLKRKLKILGLKRKYIVESPIEEICYAVISELHACGYNLGYRALHQKLISSHGLKVKRDTAYYILKLADPNGIADRLARRLRRRVYKVPGPNFIWHLDGYDKLKHFGFCIHACIDGFSRYINWLEVGVTNNDPRVTALYYLKAVKKFELVPTLMRSDAGTENCIIESLHIGLREEHNDRLAGFKSFLIGKSVHNQRIEAFWGQLRHHSMDFYMQLFESMKARNLFDGSDLHIKCLQFCFGPIIKHDLAETKNLWNKHLIRRQRGRNEMHGRPFVLYNLPEKYGARDCKQEVDLAAVDRLMKKFTIPSLLCDPEFADIAHTLVPDLEMPTDVEEALRLYKKILRYINLIH